MQKILVPIGTAVIAFFISVNATYLISRNDMGFTLTSTAIYSIVVALLFELGRWKIQDYPLLKKIFLGILFAAFVNYVCNLLVFGFYGEGIFLIKVLQVPTLYIWLIGGPVAISSRILFAFFTNRAK